MQRSNAQVIHKEAIGFFIEPILILHFRIHEQEAMASITFVESESV